MPKKFVQTTYYPDLCPWCMRQQIITTAIKTALLKACPDKKGCGYRAWIDKTSLTFKERLKFYDPIRYLKEFGEKK